MLYSLLLYSLTLVAVAVPPLSSTRFIAEGTVHIDIWKKKYTLSQKRFTHCRVAGEREEKVATRGRPRECGGHTLAARWVWAWHSCALSWTRGGPARTEDRSAAQYTVTTLVATSGKPAPAGSSCLCCRLQPPHIDASTNKAAARYGAPSAAVERWRAGRAAAPHRALPVLSSGRELHSTDTG